MCDETYHKCWYCGLSVQAWQAKLLVSGDYAHKHCQDKVKGAPYRKYESQYKAWLKNRHEKAVAKTLQANSQIKVSVKYF
jgi:hypothetical protein